MKVEKIITNTQTEELEIKGATLLSIEEAEMLPKRLREYNDVWWLRSQGCTYDRTAYVLYDGSVSYYGLYVYYNYEGVRPALQIKLESSNLKIGDTFIFRNKEFEIISETFAFCKSDIGQYWFQNHWRDKDANDYEKSDVKKFVDEWFEGVKRNDRSKEIQSL